MPGNLPFWYAQFAGTPFGMTSRGLPPGGCGIDLQLQLIHAMYSFFCNCQHTAHLPCNSAMCPPVWTAPDSTGVWHLAQVHLPWQSKP